MGKILKYCSSCDEGFADKFQFCPNCGASLQAFEMNPVAAQPKAPAPKAEEPKAPPVTREVSATPPAPAFIEAAPEVEPPPPPVQAAPPPVEETRVVEAAPVTEDEVEKEEPVVEKAAPAVAASAPVFYQTRSMDADAKPHSLEEEHDKALREGGYYLTVIEEKNVGTRNGLLLGAAIFMSLVLLSGLVINIFSKDLDVSSIDDTMFNAYLADDVVTQTDQEKQEHKKDNNAGGGGGGGRQQDETTKGDLANQTPNPQRPPEALDRHDFELKDPQASTQGNKQFQQQYDRFGDPNGRFSNFNNGPGTGGGQGTGTGTGQGSGRGTGAGSGIGSGFGGGVGNGNGNGTGNGEDDTPKRAVGESAGLKIISKPKATFTNEARQANFTGTVMLRVTFLANGSIGGVSAIKGAPYGLTEQAIAAAHNIRFEPAKVNGVPQTVTKSVEYSFTLY